MRLGRVALLLLAAALFAASVPARADWRAAAEKEVGRAGVPSGKDIIKFYFPRGDLGVKVHGMTVEPALALTGWVTLKNEGAMGTAIMGDLALKEDEVKPVMARLLKDNIWITSVSDHLMFETPRVMFVHFGSRGKAMTLARAMKEVIGLTSTPLKPKAAKGETADWSKVEAVLGKGRQEGDVIHFTFLRKDKIRELGVVLPPVLGAVTDVNFQKDGEKAAVAGYYALESGELNPVINALLESGISVTAIHNGMLFEKPRLFYAYFWGYGEPEKLARGIKAALGKADYKR